MRARSAVAGVTDRVAAGSRRLEGAATSPLHDDAVAARLGLALGVAFATCALTGLYSHLLQHDPSWIDLPARPAGLYRVTQGLHVVTGVATVPLLLAKLWTVGPKLVAWPPVRDVGHLVERIALLPLVGGALFLLMSGIANVARWYPWTFFFPKAHYWVAWITIGALVAHVGATIATSRAELRRAGRLAERTRPGHRARRRFLRGVAATGGIAALSSAGSTVGWLSPVSFLAQRRVGVGPQGLPVNKTAAAARVLETATDPAYRLVVRGAVATPLSLAVDDLRALDQHEATLPIACVEGWSAEARWRGVRVRDLLALAGAADGARVEVRSLQEGGLYNRSDLTPRAVADRDTLLALELDGEPLHLDHGYPVRLIGPNRPGVAQTKWVGELVVR